MKNCRGVEPRRGASRRNLGTRVWHYIVGNNPCVVPFQLKVTCCSGLCLWWVEIYPPSSVAIATASPQGEAFFTLCEHSKYNKHQVAKFASNFCSFILLCGAKRILQKGFPLGGKLSRKRLMRGDKFALTQGFRSPYAPYSSNGREAVREYVSALVYGTIL